LSKSDDIKQFKKMNLKGVVATHWKDVPPKELAAPGFSTRLLWSEPNGRKARRLLVPR